MEIFQYIQAFIFEVITLVMSPLNIKATLKEFLVPNSLIRTYSKSRTGVLIIARRTLHLCFNSKTTILLFGLISRYQSSYTVCLCEKHQNLTRIIKEFSLRSNKLVVHSSVISVTVNTK